MDGIEEPFSPLRWTTRRQLQQLSAAGHRAGLRVLQQGQPIKIIFRTEILLQDPYTFTEENGEDLPTVAAIKRVKLALNPQVLVKKFLLQVNIVLARCRP